ncbi:branched-chain-amino-acid transaminase [Candidatus Gottesmanbacteria bacterium RIFCSPHIGHO2_02_FULL_39_11]|uniref:Branched-chain-amino-acid aminotransferase n=1 Tax=Candidatus Gottesmanbacteria bacterium RIFCSPHIGHO2_02_FULL_39_11 TaxID=1798382 RepID=A0A1F5ZSI3_9BACT|nr:MAG: branched-chain-amino-acid transaminase [Candidatus Gottesmanbacteria bacterium RIFCSPHIGHO2_02_FULL_39_11]
MTNNSKISFPYVFFKGKIVPIGEAKVSIMTNALQYGTGIFGGIRGYVQENPKSKIQNPKKEVAIFRIADHYQRFLKSLNILNKTIPYSHKKLVDITIELAKKNAPDTDCYFRPLAYASNLGLSPNLHEAVFDFAIYMIPLGEYLPIHKGLKLMISNWIRISDVMIPARAKVTGAYINSSLAKGDAESLGFDDALMMTSEGHITEGSAANFFMVRDGVLITPSNYSDILEGITRRSIIQLARDLHIPVEEREVDRSEVYISDECFLSGTGAQVAWISEVDGRKIRDGKIGPVTGKLQKLFFDIVRGRNNKYKNWLTKI